MRNDIDRAEQRARRYWYDDGLTEIATGCVFVAVGALFLAEAVGLVASGFSSLGLIVVVFAGVLLGRWLVRVAKERITYPRTGFVQYRQRARGMGARLATGALGAILAATVALLLQRAPGSLTWIPALDGIVIGAFILYVGQKAGLSRFYLLAVMSAALGAGLSLSGLGDLLGSGIYFAGMGVALLLSGPFTLLYYLRLNRPDGGV